MQNEEKAHYLSRYFGALHGLKAVPFGLYLLVLSTRDLGWNWLGGQGNCIYTGLLLLIVFVLIYAIDQYYLRIFGRVRPLRGQPQGNLTIAGLAVFALLIMLENVLRPPFSLLGLAVAGIFIYIGFESRRGYYIPLGVIILVASLLPGILGVSLGHPIYGSLGFVLKVIIGLSVIVAGFIDHFFLMRAMQSQAGGENA